MGGKLSAPRPTHPAPPHAARNFPSEHYKNNRVGLVVAFYGLGLVTGRIQISQTDRRADGSIYGSLFNHITVGRWANGEPTRPLRFAVPCSSACQNALRLRIALCARTSKPPCN